MTNNNTAATATSYRPTTLASCDVCEDDHASVVLADGTIVCAREGTDR